jgi:hypothetical protein
MNNQINLEQLKLDLQTMSDEELKAKYQLTDDKSKGDRRRISNELQARVSRGDLSLIKLLIGGGK